MKIQTFMPMRQGKVLNLAKQLPLTPDEIADRLALCGDCEWQIDWRCQHVGCKVCPGKQKGTQPLKQLVTNRFFKCPMNKFKL